MSNVEEHDADLSEYELYVLDALYLQETQSLGRELTLGERRSIRAAYITALREATPPKKRGYKRAVKPDEGEGFQWQPSVSMRKIRPHE